MATLAQIRDGLRENLSSLSGFQISPYVLANPTPPVAWVRPSSETFVEYHRAMGAAATRNEWHMVIQVYVATATDIGAQKKLDSLIDSIKGVVESDKTLGGIAQDVFLESGSGYLEYARTDGTTALGAEFAVRVIS